MCGTPDDAEDLVQETYARVLARPRWLRDDDDLGYLLRSLRNTHRNWVRTGTRRPRTISLAEHVHRAPATPRWGDPEAAFELQVLFAGIAELPDAYRDVLVAIDLVGLPYEQAARALRIREATLTSRLHRARMRVRDHVGPGGDGEAGAGAP